MKPLFLTEDDIEGLLSVPEMIDALDVAFRDQAQGLAVSNPRRRLRIPGVMLHMMAGAIPGYFGYKAYTVGAGKVRFLFFLFDSRTTDLIAIMEADRLGQIRTGAATGLATRLLSNTEATTATLFGAGWQAESQLLAMDAVRDLQKVWVVNRNLDRRMAFIKKMQPLTKAELVSPSSAEEPVRKSQIVTTITTSRDPVFSGEWLQAGAHVNAAGGNMLLRREVDDHAILRANRIVVDSIEQAKIEVGEFVSVIETGRRQWEDFIELRLVVSGSVPARISASDITFFKSQGSALEDVAAGKLAYERALERGVGRALDL